jgi:osmotically-inducible protein OsmY
MMAVSAWAQARPAAARSASAATATRSAAPRRSDPELENAIRARLARSKKISANHFSVKVQGGVATLEGKTDVIQHKGAATRMAKAAGAVAVVNHIQVSQAARDRAARNLEQGRRRAQIKRSSAAAPAH